MAKKKPGVSKENEREAEMIIDKIPVMNGKDDEKLRE